MSAIKPIETHYAGYRFRSRLEARWAVALSARGIRWEYEAQGFLCSQRLMLGGEPIPYLPDFWLPDLGLFAEVKGSIPDEQSLLRLLNVAASLSSADGGGCHDRGGNDVVLLGPIPESPAWSPWLLHMHKGELSIDPWDGMTGNGCHVNAWPIASDGGADWDSTFYRKAFGTASGIPSWKAAADVLLRGGAHRSLVECPPGTELPWEDAYRVARHARFEHGESGNQLTPR